MDSQLVREPVFLDGANTRSRLWRFGHRAELIGIQFSPGGAYPFLRMPLSELQDVTQALEALDRPALLTLQGRLAAAPDWRQAVALLDEWLLTRLATGQPPHALIQPGLAHIRAGLVRIPELAEQLAVSERQLERIFSKEVGLSPKQYARLLRVEQARETLKRAASDDQNGAQLAADLGYFDQAHFIRDFKAVTGMTPAEYARRRRTES